MRLRTRLLVLSVTTVAVIVGVLLVHQLDSLTATELDNAADRSSWLGKQLQSLMFHRITDIPPGVKGVSVAETKRIWTSTIAGDQELAALLVEWTAVRPGVIVEINIIGEDGNVLLSSVPFRVGQNEQPHNTLISIRDAGALDRLKAIITSSSDYETRVTLGIGDQTTPVFQIQLLVSSILLRDKIKPELNRTLYFSAFALFAAAGLAIFSSQLALRPVRRIARAVDILAAGKPLGLSWVDPALAGQSREGQGREDSEVAAVEYKLSLLGEQMRGARRDADQMRSAVGSLARGVAHEIKNPLNAIALRLESLRARVADEVPEAEAEIDLVSGEVQRLDRVVRTFLDLNRPMEPDIREFDPVELAAAVLEIIRPAATEAGVELQLLKPDLPFAVHADRGLIEQSVLNVVNNAIQALNGGGLVETSVALVKDTCVITVTDNGPGMTENVRERIFEPYFTTKSTGSGIGLAFTKRVMELHRGQITARSSPGQGTTIALSFPRGPAK
jgi:signal transduction histidine kinase